MVMFYGDIPGGAPSVTPELTVASVASNGAAASARLAFRAPQAVRITHAWWQPDTVAQATASASASYRRLTLINGGQGQAGTVVLGSLNLTTSLQSLATRAFTLASTPTLAAGDTIIFSQATVGGDNAEGSVLRAGTLFVGYRPISPRA
jgi:hypothetical protein